MFPFKPTFPPMGDASNIPQPLPGDAQWANANNFHVDLDTVDWATLAQQWITMKEACPSVTPLMFEPQQFMTMPMAPPPPNISKMPTYPIHSMQHDLGEEQGEAPMEVEREDEDDISHNNKQSAPSINSNHLYKAPPAPVNLFSSTSHHQSRNNDTSNNAPKQSNWNKSNKSEPKHWHKSE